MYKRIKELCENKGITVTQMCKELSITRSCLSELSTGRTENLSYENAKKIADYFSVSTAYIYNGIEEDPDEILRKTLFGKSEGITEEMLEQVRQYAQEIVRREEEKKNHH